MDGCVGNRCSTYQSGDLTKTDKAVDGIFGFGPGALSVVSQLSSRGITPKVFSHCLKGDGNGGGILVLGEILEPSIVYSPLVPSQYVLFCTYFLIFFPQFVDNFSLILHKIDMKGMFKVFLKEIFGPRYLHYCQLANNNCLFSMKLSFWLLEFSIIIC